MEIAQNHRIKQSDADIHTEDVEDIISAPPSWLVRWGISLIFGVLIMILAMAYMIHYPDTIKVSMRINSLNSPKPVIAKMQGKLVRLLVTDGQTVHDGQPLAYLESTADHESVLRLLNICKGLEQNIIPSSGFEYPFFNTAKNLRLGELQSSYETFYQAYLAYRSSVSNGLSLKKQKYLQNDLQSLSKEKMQLNMQRKLEQRDSAIAQEEYNVHKDLTNQGVESSMELKDEESKFLNRQSPLIQLETSIINANNNISNKQREIVELNDQISKDKVKFIQALYTFIDDVETWKNKYVLSALEDGKVSFVGILQENETLNPNQQIFFIKSNNENFFGEINIPQVNKGKVKVGQQVLIKFRSYPYEEFGIATGRLSSVADIPLRDSIYISKVSFNSKSFSTMRPGVHLEYAMLADAEIVTENTSLLSRLTRNLTRMLN